MTDDFLIDVMQELDDELLREAMGPPIVSSRRAWRRALFFAAAGAAVFAAGLLVFRAVSAPKPTVTPPAETGSEFAAAAMSEQTTAPEPAGAKETGTDAALTEVTETTTAAAVTEPPRTEARHTTAQSGTEAPAGPQTGAPETTTRPHETEPPGTRSTETSAEPGTTEKTGRSRLFGDGDSFWDRFPFLGTLLGGSGSSADAPTASPNPVVPGGDSPTREIPATGSPTEVPATESPIGTTAPEVPGGDTPTQRVPATEPDPQTARALRGNAACTLTAKPDGTLRAGDTVTVTVQLENAQALALIMLSVRYDPDALTLERVKTAAPDGWTGEAGTKETGLVKYGGFSNETVSPGRAALCTLTFTVTAAAPTDTQLVLCVERYGICKEDINRPLNIASAFPEQAVTLHIG